MTSPNIIVKKGKSARRYWTREQTERIVREGTARDIAEHLPHDVQAGLLNAHDSDSVELQRRHFVKFETPAIHKAMGRPEPTDGKAEEGRRLAEEARKRLRSGR